MTNEQTSSAAINERIKSVSVNYRKADADVHEIGMMILKHSSEFGDCTGAGRLIAAMPNSSRRGMVVDWFGLYSPINITKVDGSFTAKYRQPSDKKFNNFNLDAAAANPWFEAKTKDKELEKALDLSSARGAIYGIIKKLEGQRDQKNEAGEFVVNDNERNAIDNMLVDVRKALLVKQAA